VRVTPAGRWQEYAQPNASERSNHAHVRSKCQAPCDWPCRNCSTKPRKISTSHPSAVMLTSIHPRRSETRSARSLAASFLQRIVRRAGACRELRNPDANTDRTRGAVPGFGATLERPYAACTLYSFANRPVRAYVAAEPMEASFSGEIVQGYAATVPRSMGRKRNLTVSFHMEKFFTTMVVVCTLYLGVFRNGSALSAESPLEADDIRRTR
jgi:hypothetical protein